jgi:glutamine cyclotransferase
MKDYYQIYFTSKIKKIVSVLFFIVYLMACSEDPKPVKKRKSAQDVPVLSYSVQSKLPHSINSFTEGLLIHNGELYESTGSPSELPQTKSVLGIVNKETGEIEVKKELNKRNYFGEGMVIFHNKVYQLTYKKQTCFVYDLKTFEPIQQHFYSNKEGWGMTTDGKHLIMSDGTHKLTFRDPNDFRVVKTLPVKANHYAVQYLNELEYVNGYIYANVWPGNEVVKINAENGRVEGKMDLSNLRQMALLKNPRASETNGIAYDSIANTLLVTGKMWPEIYELKLTNF